MADSAPWNANLHPSPILGATSWDRVCKVLRERGTKADAKIADRIDRQVAATRDRARQRWVAQEAEKIAALPGEISTRRVEDGIVHEMADLGVGTMCGRDLSEPWTYTDDEVTCEECLSCPSVSREVARRRSVHVGPASDGAENNRV